MEFNFVQTMTRRTGLACVFDTNICETTVNIDIKTAIFPISGVQSVNMGWSSLGHANMLLKVISSPMQQLFDWSSSHPMSFLVSIPIRSDISHIPSLESQTNSAAQQTSYCCNAETGCRFHKCCNTFEWLLKAEYVPQQCLKANRYVSDVCVPFTMHVSKHTHSNQIMYQNQNNAAKSHRKRVGISLHFSLEMKLQTFLGGLKGGK